jgi:uncharacterized membrane protein YdbT with pleckstrin-like domain
MSYIEHSLARSESLLYTARFPWFYQVSALALLLVSAACGIGAYIYGYPLAGVGLLLAGLVLFAVIMLPIWTTEIGVTDQRLIDKRGLIWRKTQELQLRAVEEVNLQQGLLGRVLDFGHLELHGTGMEDIKLPLLADPIGLRKALQDGMAAAGQPAVAMPPSSGSPRVESQPALPSHR